MTAHPWHAHLLLLRPRVAQAKLDAIAARRLVPTTPNLWQIELGILRMWHRILFRSDTIGTSPCPVRPTWRARLWHFRPLRFPFLLTERAVTPWDLSGLLASPEQIERHLLAAHHAAHDFIYDFQLLLVAPEHLDRLRALAARVVEHDDRRSRWLRDLVVHEGYHEELLAGLDRFLRGELELDPHDDPDVSFLAYLRWCARQPPTPAATVAAWRAGHFSLTQGLAA